MKEKGIPSIPIKLNLSWLDGFYTEFFTLSVFLWHTFVIGYANIVCVIIMEL